MTIDQAEILKWVIAIVGFVIVSLLALVGWLLRRAIEQLDEKLDAFTEGHANHESRLVRVETHLGFGVPEPVPARPRHNGHHG